MQIVFIGDIIGQPGREVLSRMMPKIKREFSPDAIIVNGENAAHGHGLTRDIADELFSLGVDVITSGNHIWDKKEIENWIDDYERVIRPVNYPEKTPGRGISIIPMREYELAIVNIQGRVTMPPCDCPFRSMESVLKNLADVDNILVDIHAEATAEKEAFGLYFDGQVAAVLGTHTHIQTADERILPKGTAYITDVGMTGGAGGVIGYQLDEVMIRFLQVIPRKLEPEKKDPVVMGVSIKVNNGHAENITRFQFRPT